MTSVDHHMGDSAPEDEAFSYPEFEQQVELLRYLIDNGDRIALVRGKAGAGKSTLARRVAGLEPPGWVLCGIEGNPMLHKRSSCSNSWAGGSPLQWGGVIRWRHCASASTVCGRRGAPRGAGG
ncbi:MAG: hypothetical protein AB2812_03665 [Candidatus Sedimenticola endophacoides]